MKEESMSIKYKILMILLFLALFTHTLITSVYYFNSQKLVKGLASYHLVSIANVQHQRMNTFVVNNQDKLNLIKSRTQMRRSLANFIDTKDPSHLLLVKKILDDALKQTRSLKDIFVMGLDGRVLVSSKRLKDRKRFDSHPLFQSGKTGSAASLLMGSQENQVPSIIFSAPLKLDGKTLGVVAIEVNMRRLNELLRDYTGLGKTGEVLMATKSIKGNVLFFTPLRFENFPQLFAADSSFAGLLKSELRDKSDNLMSVKDYRDKPVFAIGRFLKGLNIGIIVKMDQDEVLSLNEDLQQLILYLIIFLLFVVLISSLFLAHKITRPVITITDVAVMISQGDFKRRIKAFSDDELGKLAQALNKMADKLIDSNLLLEEKVIEKTAELQKANKKLSKIAQTDALTGLKNRGYFDEQVQVEWQRNMRHQRSMSFILLDIDHFKSINDNKGHQVGDNYLKAVANVLKRNVNRAGDLLARYGGEEFVLALSDTSEEDVNSFGEKLRQSVEELKLLNEHSSVSHFVTISIGICSTIPNPEGNWNDFIKLADDALYEAKNSGRNKVVSYFR
jgi:diguanylate cyclase (GGDEF)-like protein